MKNVLVSLSLACGLLLAACQDTEGLSPESNKPLKGNVNSPVVLTEYADLQCPACRAAHSDIVEPILQNYGNQIAYEFKHFPIRTIHRYALEAALAAECAADQGKFWEFVDHTFENQSEMTMDAFTEWGREVGISDMELYERCRSTQIKKDVVNEEYQEGRALGVSGTPTFFVNGQRVESSAASIGQAIEEALAKNTQPL